MDLIASQHIENKIYALRQMQVMFDSDLAEFYQVEVKALNQAVKRNTDRFPEYFRFQLNEDEFNNLRSQIVTFESKVNSLRSQFVTIENQRGKHTEYLPFAFSRMDYMAAQVMNLLKGAEA